MEARLGFGPLGYDDEEEVGEGDGEAEHEADGCLFAL